MKKKQKKKNCSGIERKNPKWNELKLHGRKVPRERRPKSKLEEEPNHIILLYYFGFPLASICTSYACFMCSWSRRNYFYLSNHIFETEWKKHIIKCALAHCSRSQESTIKSKTICGILLSSLTYLWHVCVCFGLWSGRQKRFYWMSHADLNECTDWQSIEIPNIFHFIRNRSVWMTRCTHISVRTEVTEIVKKL